MFCCFFVLLQADDALLDNVIGLRDSSAACSLEEDTGGTEEEKGKDGEDARMGVGKNTSKSLDSSSDGGKYEDDRKHGVDFYPIPVQSPISQIELSSSKIAVE